MTIAQRLSQHFRQLFFGGNLTFSDFKTVLADVDWRQATAKTHSLNTIAALVFHTNYYVSGVLDVLRGGPLVIRDRFSFDLPPIESHEDWQRLLDKTFSDAEQFADALERLPEEIFDKDFTDPKYGDYHRNMLGMIEHCHYHLGQIAIIKKIVAER